MKLGATAYSYRLDPSVPEFSDDGPRTVMDAQCSICARGARWISRNDRADEFRIIPMQSELGVALMRHYEMDPTDPLSWLYLHNGRAFTSLDAVIRVGHRLGGLWRALGVLRVLPRSAQDFLYGLVARNRYRLGHGVTLCEMTDADVKKRLMT